MKKTIIDLFESSVEKYGAKTFLLEKKHRAFEPTTYAETKELALETGAGLAAIGIRPKDKVAILAEGSNAWIVSELGMFYAGAVSVPLSVKLEESNDLLFRMRHAEVKALFVSKYQLPKIRRIRAELPEVKHIIVIGHIPLEPGETALGTLRRLGRDYLSKHREEFLAIGRGIGNDDYATITYTSGTTADPKGVVLTHRNYTANVEQSLSRIDIPSSFRTLIILPLDHCFAHVVGFYIMIACGATVATVQVGATPMETLKNIPQNIREVRPHFLLSVPALAKNFRKNIEGARAAGLQVGVYFFSQAVNEKEAIEEASMCVQYVQGYQVDMPIFIDLEDVWDPDDGSGGRANNLSVSQRTSVARAFCDTVRSAGYKAGIYASYYYLLDRMHIGQLEGDNYIWMASYADSTSYPRSHDMWQYTDNGRVPGITTWDGRAASVDMNVWYE